MYRGRFAPSPTGPLHLGSLFAAAVSYLVCLQEAGAWLLRVDDIDPPREIPGAADDIVARLDTLGFEWTGPVYYQSQRHAAYRAAVEHLDAQALTYPCVCSRAEISAHPDSLQGRRYPGTCRLGATSEGESALRVRCADDHEIDFDDAFQGPQKTPLGATMGDYVIWRKDGLPAYHLANVVDDDWLNITHVVRGADLLQSTAVHIHLQQQLELPAVRYAHVPVLLGTDGHKLSKQAGSPGIHKGMERSALLWVLEVLGLTAQLQTDFGPMNKGSGPALKSLWPWAATHWNRTALNNVSSLPADIFGPLPQID